MHVPAPHISIIEALVYGLRATKQHFWKFLKLQLIGAAIIISPLFILLGLLLCATVAWYQLYSTKATEIIYRLDLPLGALLSILLYLVIGFVFIALKKLAITLHDTNTCRIRSQFPSLKVTVCATLLEILGLLTTNIGLLFFIIPGIILKACFYFALYIFIDDPNKGIIGSLKESTRISRGNRFKIFIFSIIEYIISVSGLLLFGVGILFTLPLGIMATVQIYRTLKPRTVHS